MKPALSTHMLHKLRKPHLPQGGDGAHVTLGSGCGPDAEQIAHYHTETELRHL